MLTAASSWHVQVVFIYLFTLFVCMHLSIGFSGWFATEYSFQNHCLACVGLNVYIHVRVF